MRCKYFDKLTYRLRNDPSFHFISLQTYACLLMLLLLLLLLSYNHRIDIVLHLVASVKLLNRLTEVYVDLPAHSFYIIPVLFWAQMKCFVLYLCYTIIYLLPLGDSGVNGRSTNTTSSNSSSSSSSNNNNSSSSSSSSISSSSSSSSNSSRRSSGSSSCSTSSTLMSIYTMCALFSSLPARTVTIVPSIISPSETTLKATGNVLFERQCGGKTVQTNNGLLVRISSPGCSVKKSPRVRSAKMSDVILVGGGIGGIAATICCRPFGVANTLLFDSLSIRAKKN
uniref:FAD/NAD(P)-binding domain-containing protein n=1 Tax=Glossina pallidipes TaxID=7398 RepID=A0A1B0A2P1_GLOPL